MNDLDNEDSKKDTLVDVVFKKALKEFRQNIFSFYSSALAVSWTILGDLRQLTYEKFGSAVEDNMEAVFNERLLKFLVFILGIGREKHTDWSQINTFLQFPSVVFFPSYNVESSYKMINSHIINVILWLSTILISHNPFSSGFGL